MSPELEVLDQLLGGDLPVNEVRKLFPDDDAFWKSVSGLIHGGDVMLLDQGVSVLDWRVRQLVESGTISDSTHSFLLHLTDQGASKIQ